MSIDSPTQLRSVLLQYMTLLIEGKVSVAQANAAASLSAEIHKSLNDSFSRGVKIIENPELASLGYVDPSISLEVVK